MKIENIIFKIIFIFLLTIMTWCAYKIAIAVTIMQAELQFIECQVPPNKHIQLIPEISYLLDATSVRCDGKVNPL